MYLSKNLDIKNIKIYTNSESTQFSLPDFDIENIHPPKNTYWSNRLKNCVENIKEDVVFSIPEECILESKVDTLKFSKALNMIESNKNIASICFVHIPGPKFDDLTYLPYIKRKYNYKNMITQQAALWKREKYLSYISDNENPWEYEVLGSARGIKGIDEFYCVNDDEKEVTDYNYGFLIYRGYWCEEEIIRLKKERGIVFNLGKRHILSKKQIDNKFNRNSLFYWKLRIKKYLILLSKKLK
jgi:hypothetical protein